MNTLYFEKLSQFDRQAEPVTVAIPFARGKLTDPLHLLIYDGDRALPAQRRVLATWQEGSVKWLLVHFQPDLPGNRDKTLRFEVSSHPTDIQPDVTVTLTNTGDEMVIAPGAESATDSLPDLRVDTGPLSFLVPNQVFWPLQKVVLNGARLWHDSPFMGFMPPARSRISGYRLRSCRA